MTKVKCALIKNDPETLVKFYQLIDEDILYKKVILLTIDAEHSLIRLQDAMNPFYSPNYKLVPIYEEFLQRIASEIEGVTLVDYDYMYSDLHLISIPNKEDNTHSLKVFGKNARVAKRITPTYPVTLPNAYELDIKEFVLIGEMNAVNRTARYIEWLFKNDKPITDETFTELVNRQTIHSKCLLVLEDGFLLEIYNHGFKLVTRDQYMEKDVATCLASGLSLIYENNKCRLGEPLGQKEKWIVLEHAIDATYNTLL